MTRTTQIIAVLFILIAGYILWDIMAKAPEVQDFSSEVTATASGVEDAKTLETLINMRSLRLDGRIFESPAFQALVNTERQIIPEPVGRQNPFAPVGSDILSPAAGDAGLEAQNTPVSVQPRRQPPAQNPQDEELFEE